MNEDEALNEEQQAYLEKMQAERGYTLETHRVLAKEDMAFLKAYNSLLEAAYLDQGSVIDQKTRELILIGILVSVRSLPDHIKTHLEVAKKLGITKAEVLEVLEMLMPPAGVPAFMQGLALWKEVYGV